MKKRIFSLLLAAVMVLGVCVSILSVSAEETENKLPFTDVKEKNWFKPYVERVYAEGIMEGKTETTFAPNEDMTRAQLVTILYRLAGATETGLGEALEFTDTKKTAWYADYVGWAVKENLVTGYPRVPLHLTKRYHVRRSQSCLLSLWHISVLMPSVTLYS